MQGIYKPISSKDTEVFTDSKYPFIGYKREDEDPSFVTVNTDYFTNVYDGFAKRFYGPVRLL